MLTNPIKGHKRSGNPKYLRPQAVFHSNFQTSVPQPIHPASGFALDEEDPGDMRDFTETMRNYTE
jgi:hypothetical protein